MKQMKYIIILTFPILIFGQTEHLVQPNMADPLSSAPNNFHYTYTNQNITQKNKLFLFFPGTGAVPFNYREILKHAANLGYHSIGLTYPNSDAINQICLSSTDTTCHSRARLEVFDGIDRHSAINIDTNNCIETRTLKLLRYLNNTYPTENWGQYYTGNQIQWNKVIVSGHSQGGGHAGIISKIKQVERVVMFAALDWITLLNRNADWITWKGQTPDNKYYGFTHQNDEAVYFNTIQTTWANYGMNNFGNLILVDTTTIPYNNSHQLYTLLSPANDPTKFHGSPVADAYTPINSGIPVFRPVWTYMIEGNQTLSSINESYSSSTILIYPNPISSFVSLKGIEINNLDYKIYSSQGHLMLEGKLENSTIDLTYLLKGIYILQLNQENNRRTFKLMKE